MEALKNLYAAYVSFLMAPVVVWQGETVSRKSFWSVIGVNYLISIALIMIVGQKASLWMSILFIIPNISWQIERLRDVGLAGWKLFFAMVLIIPALYYFFKSKPESEMVLSESIAS